MDESEIEEIIVEIITDMLRESSLSDNSYRLIHTTLIEIWNKNKFKLSNPIRVPFALIKTGLSPEKWKEEPISNFISEDEMKIPLE